MRRVFFAALLAAAVPASAAVFLARHAEKADPKDPKSRLSSKGSARARDLARVLKDVPLKAVFATEYERTQQTAAPSAADHGLKTTVLSSEDDKGLAKLLAARGAAEDLLVVGHSDTLPDILSDLGVSTKTVIDEGDYDRLYVVTPRADGPELHVLHYGAAPAAAAPARMKR